VIEFDKFPKSCSDAGSCGCHPTFFLNSRTEKGVGISAKKLKRRYSFYIFIIFKVNAFLEQKAKELGTGITDLIVATISSNIGTG
jgi:hypothetical protein